MEGRHSADDAKVLCEDTGRQAWLGPSLTALAGAIDSNLGTSLCLNAISEQLTYTTRMEESVSSMHSYGVY